jgi:hypothetical protein
MFETHTHTHTHHTTYTASRQFPLAIHNTICSPLLAQTSLHYVAVCCCCTVACCCCSAICMTPTTACTSASVRAVFALCSASLSAVTANHVSQYSIQHMYVLQSAVAHTAELLVAIFDYTCDSCDIITTANITSTMHSLQHQKSLQCAH